MRSEADTPGGMRFSRWPLSVVMWTTLTTFVVSVWGSSRCLLDVVDARVVRDRVNDPNREVSEAPAIQFLIDALQSSRAAVAEPDLERALCFVARLQLERTLSEPEREFVNRSSAPTFTKSPGKPLRTAQMDRVAGP